MLESESAFCSDMVYAAIPLPFLRYKRRRTPQKLTSWPNLTNLPGNSCWNQIKSSHKELFPYQNCPISPYTKSFIPHMWNTSHNKHYKFAFPKPRREVPFSLPLQETKLHKGKRRQLIAEAAKGMNEANARFPHWDSFLLVHRSSTQIDREWRTE